MVRSDRQTQNFVRQSFGERKIATLPAAVTIRTGKMRRRGVVHLRANLPRRKKSLQCFASLRAHNKQMPYGLRPQRDEREHKIANAAQLFEIPCGERRAPRVPSGEVRKFHAQKCRLHFFEPGIDAGVLVSITDLRTIVAQMAKFVRESSVVGGDRSGVGERAEIFARIKTDASRMSERTALPAVTKRSVGLRSIFEQQEPVPVGDRTKGPHVGGLAIEVNGQDCFGARRDQRFNASWVEIVGAFVALARHRTSADVRDSEPSGNIAVRGNDHFVARTDSARHQDELQRFEPVRDADAMRDSDRRRILVFKRLELGTQKKPPRVHDAAISGVEVTAEFFGRGFEIEDGYFHSRGHSAGLGTASQAGTHAEASRFCFSPHGRLANARGLPLPRAVISAFRFSLSRYRGEGLWVAIVLVATAWFYVWTATSAGSPGAFVLQKNDLYNRLTDGFLAGQLSFVEKPNPAFAQLADPWDPVQNGPLREFHDVTYYDGKYFLYFGPAPVVTLLLPWKALTGTYLPQNVAAAIFGLAGATAAIAMILVLRRKYFFAAPAWMSGLFLLVVTFGNFVPVLLRRPVYYELAIASAYAFVMAAMLAVVLALDTGPHRRLWLGLASLAYGLAVASRPNTIFGAVLLCAPFFAIWRAWRANARIDRRALLADAVATGLPLLLIVASLLVYNWQRFGSWTEFGTSYMFAGLHPQKDVVTSFRFLPTNLWYYVFAPAQFSAFFPFVQVVHMPWFAMPTGYIGQENMYGVLPNLPFFWMLWFVQRMLRDGGLSVAAGLRDFIFAILALAALNALVFLRLSGASCRYLVDLLTPLLPLACIGVFWAEQTVTGKFRRVAIRVLWIAALGWTVLFNVLVSLQHNELLRHHNPAVYRRLAHAFNHVSVWLGKTAPDKVGSVRVRLVLPQERTGKLEPLIVTGLSFRADFLYIFYTDDRHVQIGFEHTSYGGPMTKPPIEIDYNVEHTLEVEMGSFYPPVEHPFYDGMSAGEIARRKRTLRVVLDGREVLAGEYDFYDSSPGDVSVGRNPVQDAFGRRFTGRIVSVERVQAMEPAK
jgi:hypothetical protein